MLSSVLFSCVRANYGGYVGLCQVRLCLARLCYVVLGRLSRGQVSRVLESSAWLRRLSRVMLGFVVDGGFSYGLAVKFGRVRVGFDMSSHGN